MRSEISIALAIALAACASEPEQEPACIEATQYMGTTIACDDGAGVCIKRGQELACLPRCADASPVCMAGEWASTIAVSDAPPVCYCEPAPTDHVWQPIIRDHR